MVAAVSLPMTVWAAVIDELRADSSPHSCSVFNAFSLTSRQLTMHGQRELFRQVRFSGWLDRKRVRGTSLARLQGLLGSNKLRGYIRHATLACWMDNARWMHWNEQFGSRSFEDGEWKAGGAFHQKQLDLRITLKALLSLLNSLPQLDFLKISEVPFGIGEFPTLLAGADGTRRLRHLHLDWCQWPAELWPITESPPWCKLETVSVSYHPPTTTCTGGFSGHIAASVVAQMIRAFVNADYIREVEVREGTLISEIIGQLARIAGPFKNLGRLTLMSVPPTSADDLVSLLAAASNLSCLTLGACEDLFRGRDNDDGPNGENGALVQGLSHRQSQRSSFGTFLPNLAAFKGTIVEALALLKAVDVGSQSLKLELRHAFRTAPNTQQDVGVLMEDFSSRLSEAQRSRVRALYINTCSMDAALGYDEGFEVDDGSRFVKVVTPEVRAVFCNLEVFDYTGS